MLIFRYLTKEVFVTLAALTTILLLIFLSNQFVQYMGRAAAGVLPGVVVIKLMMLEIPNLLGLLLPLGFYVAILVAYGRFYADNEMTVLHACGYSRGRLLRQTMLMAFFVAALVMVMMLWLSPKIATGRASLIRSTGVSTLIKTIIPQRFREVSKGRVFYVGKMSRQEDEAENIFLAQIPKSPQSDVDDWQILWAKSGTLKSDEKTNEEFVVLTDGAQYEGKPGVANFKVTRFATYKARLLKPKVRLKDDVRTLPSASLWPLNNKDKRKVAELQWRLSIPLMVLSLAFIAVPLSKVEPRTGKYAKLLPAVIIYIIYANMMFVGRDWIMDGTLPWWLGLWWLHLSVFLLGGILLWTTRRH